MDDLLPGPYLPLDLLRAFVAVAETGSLARAAAVVRRTPSAVSLQMGRLASAAGRPLLTRAGRGVALNEAGRRLLPAAREVLAASARARMAAAGLDAGEAALAGPVRVGLVQDFADGPLPAALAAFAARYPGVLLSLVVGRSSDLRARAADGDLDLAVAWAARRRGRTVAAEPMAWVGTAALAALDPLPLAVLEAPCPFRDAALAALRRSRRRWRVVVATESLSAVRAAVAAGLALGCRTAASMPGLPVLGAREGLPPLPEAAWELLIPRPLGPAARALSGEVRAAIAGRRAALPPVPLHR